MTGELPKYVLHNHIRSGAASEVWRGEAVGSPGRLVAVKRVTVGADRRMMQALSREVDALARLDHPSILKLLDVVADGDGVALIAPYATGGSLAGLLAGSTGGLPPATVADIGARLGAALAAAHNAGIVHRDVKPANILFDAEGQALVADFGTAQLKGELVPVAGTAEYLDPAVLAGREPDERTDVYGLGVTLFEALSGVPPYAASTPRQTLAAAQRGVHVPLAQLCDAPAVLTAAVERAMRRDPDERFATASEFAGHLDEARRTLEAASPQAQRSVPGEPPPPPGSGKRSAGTLGAVPTASRAPRRPAPRQSPQRPARDLPIDGERSHTATFGPGPPRPPDEPSGAPGVDRRLLLLTAALAVLVPVAIVVWHATRGGDAVSLTEIHTEEDAPTADKDEVADDGPSTGVRERIPPPPCDDIERPEGAQGAVLLGDVAGRGCSVPVVWDGEQLLVPAADGTVDRYDFGAQDEDVVLLGDWSCDGADSPGLYRPGTGEVFLFDAFADEGREVTVTGDPTGVVDGTPTVVTDGQGCDRIEVAS